MQIIFKKNTEKLQIKLGILAFSLNFRSFKRFRPTIEPAKFPCKVSVEFVKNLAPIQIPPEISRKNSPKIEENVYFGTLSHGLIKAMTIADKKDPGYFSRRIA